MKPVKHTDVFDKWFTNLKDVRAVALITSRIRRLAMGNPGDCRHYGRFSEMKIDYGPGYRVYYRDADKEIIILLCGGDKTTQATDMVTARELAKNY